MAMASHDPQAGYYARRDPLGSAGDFTTAPEISQIFGELIGLCCADWWQRSGGRDPVALVELGPGRGTLLMDFLRAANTMPAFRRALRPYLMEASPVLRELQRKQLAEVDLRFVAGIDELPDGPLLLVANEFLDALPIRQLIRHPQGWTERLVGLAEDGRLVFTESAPNPALTLLVPPALRDVRPGTIVEISPAAAALAAGLGARLSQWPGLALLIDYGRERPADGSTLAAIRHHEPVGVLEEPGRADLSAHVDFAAFAAHAEAAGAVVHGPVPQGRFLQALGAGARLAALARNAGPAQREALENGLMRLIHPAQMGELFKVLGLTSPGAPAPAGFE